MLEQVYCGKYLACGGVHKNRQKHMAWWNSLPSVKSLAALDKNLAYSWIFWYESCQNSYQKVHEFARSCKIVSRNSRDELTKVNENKQKSTPTAAWSAYPSRSCREVLLEPSKNVGEFFFITHGKFRDEAWKHFVGLRCSFHYLS